MLLCIILLFISGIATFVLNKKTFHIKLPTTGKPTKPVKPHPIKKPTKPGIPGTL